MVSERRDSRVVCRKDRSGTEWPWKCWHHTDKSYTDIMRCGQLAKRGGRIPLFVLFALTYMTNIVTYFVTCSLPLSRALGAKKRSRNSLHVESIFLGSLITTSHVSRHLIDILATTDSYNRITTTQMVTSQDHNTTRDGSSRKGTL